MDENKHDTQEFLTKRNEMAAALKKKCDDGLKEPGRDEEYYRGLKLLKDMVGRFDKFFKGN